MNDTLHDNTQHNGLNYSTQHYGHLALLEFFDIRINGTHYNGIQHDDIQLTTLCIMKLNIIMLRT